MLLFTYHPVLLQTGDTFLHHYTKPLGICFFLLQFVFIFGLTVVHSIWYFLLLVACIIELVVQVLLPLQVKTSKADCRPGLLLEVCLACCVAVITTTRLVRKRNETVAAVTVCATILSFLPKQVMNKQQFPYVGHGESVKRKKALPNFGLLQLFQHLVGFYLHCWIIRIEHWKVLLLTDKMQPCAD